MIPFTAEQYVHMERSYVRSKTPCSPSLANDTGEKRAEAFSWEAARELSRHAEVSCRPGLGRRL
jgi:hypothetical protein